MPGDCVPWTPADRAVADPGAAHRRAGSLPATLAHACFLPGVALLRDRDRPGHRGTPFSPGLGGLRPPRSACPSLQVQPRSFDDVTTAGIAGFAVEMPCAPPWSCCVSCSRAVL